VCEEPRTSRKPIGCSSKAIGLVILKPNNNHVNNTNSSLADCDSVAIGLAVLEPNNNHVNNSKASLADNVNTPARNQCQQTKPTHEPQPANTGYNYTPV